MPKTVKHPTDKTKTYTYGQRGRKPQWVTDLEATPEPKTEPKPKKSKKLKYQVVLDIEMDSWQGETEAERKEYLEKSSESAMLRQYIHADVTGVAVKKVK